MRPAVFDPLAEYCRWIVTQPLHALGVPPDGALRDYGHVISLVLHRQPPFQTELFFVKPGSAFPLEHRHPHVDTFEVGLHGRVHLTLNGAPVMSPDDVETVAAAGWPASVPPVRIRPSDFHGATVGPGGGAFLSVQLWLGGRAPTSVGEDWEGPIPHAAHAALLAADGRPGPEGGDARWAA